MAYYSLGKMSAVDSTPIYVPIPDQTDSGVVIPNQDTVTSGSTLPIQTSPTTMTWEQNGIAYTTAYVPGATVKPLSMPDQSPPAQQWEETPPIIAETPGLITSIPVDHSPDQGIWDKYKVPIIAVGAGLLLWKLFKK